MNGISGLGRFIYKILPGFIILLMTWSCATIQAPTGGPEDETPPSLVYSDPENGSANFNNSRITLGFSEYVQLKDIEKFLLISPPLNKDPDFRIKGRSLVIKLKDTLRSNTTYSFYFGEAIVDLTESNPLSNFNFAFSTGSYIDSLGMSGRVADAYTRLPVKDVLLMLYSNTADSAAMLERPVYVSRTNESGDYVFTNLADGKYRLVALKDGNSDYLYNLPNEQIGFFDSLVEPCYQKPEVRKDTLKVRSEGPHFDISLFPQPDSIQRNLKAFMTAPHVMTLVFRYPLQNPEFEPLDSLPLLKGSFREFNQAKDTVTFWLKPEMPDTLRLKVFENGEILDTLNIATIFKQRNPERGKPQVADTTLRFATTTSRGNVLGYNLPFIFTFPNPLESFDASLLRLMSVKGKDSLVPDLAYADSTMRRIKLKYNWKSGEDYKLLIPAGAFRDIYGQTNDTVRAGFSVKLKDDYGLFKVKATLVNVPHPVIIQLLGEKGVVVQQHTITESGDVDFGFLAPGKYGLKAIYDANANGKWDTGVFLKQRQPERVAIHPKVFEIRGNWELEEEWQL